MILTEQEAAEKWCPQTPMIAVRAPGDGFQGHVIEGRCVGSRCMAWRHANATRRQDENSGIHIVGGYCGLVGKP